jgi:hypothetical protein
MPSCDFRVVFFAGLLCLLPLGAFAADGIVTADTSVRSTQPLQNFGTMPQLIVNPSYRSYVQFDLTSIVPAGATAQAVSSATLFLYVNAMGAPGTITLTPVCGAWSENTITFANAPPDCTSGSTSFAVSAADQVIAVDVTSIVQNWISGSTGNNGLDLASLSGAAVYFDSKESVSTSQPARLAVSFALPGPQGAQGATGTTGPVGLQGPTGPQGSPGSTGPSGIANYKWSHLDDFLTPGANTLVLQCPANTDAIAAACGSADSGNPIADTVVTYVGLDFVNNLNPSGNPTEALCGFKNNTSSIRNGRVAILCRSH